MKGFVHIMKFEMNNTNGIRLFGDTLRHLVNHYVDKLGIDFDGDYVVTSDIVSVYDNNVESASTLSRFIGKPCILLYDSYTFKLSINREMIVFLCYMINNFNEFVNYSRLLSVPVIINLIKIQMLNDYKYGYSTPLEKEFLKRSLNMVVEHIYRSQIHDWFEIHIMIFTHAHMSNGINHGLMIELNRDFEKDIKSLVENRLLMNGYNRLYDTYDEQCETFNKFFSIYYKFNSIYSPRYIDKLKENLDHEYDELVPNMKKLLDELSNIFAIWNLTKIDAMKKYPEYKDTLKNVKFCIANAMGMMKMIDKIQPEAVFTDIKYEAKKTKITVYMNLDRLLYEHVSLMYKDVPYSEKRFHHEFAFKHELGHIVHYCELRSNKKLTYVKQNLKKITESERKHWESLPVDDRLDYNYWYYTCLPFERRANELMGLTIEDVYRAHFKDVPPSVKQLLEEENNNK